MYCKHCGKTIEEDSIFCKYCGKNVSCDAVQNQRRLIRHFGNLSRRKQTAIIVYGIWFLVWMCFLIDDPNDYAVAFFVFNVVIPFMIIGIWHICKIYKGKKGKGDKKKKERKEKKENVPMDTHKSRQVQSSTEDNNNSSMVLLKSNASQMPTQPSTTMETENHSHILLGNLPVILSELLLTFARNKGKMQIINQKVSDDNYDHYCQFTADDGTITRVNFSNSTKSLTAQDISKQKFLLAVNTLADGSYCLDYIEDKKHIIQ